MCDPVTLTAVSGFASAQGASMLATYGTGTFLGTVGSGLVTASTYINTSSSIYKASSAISGLSGVASLANTVSAGARVYAGYQQQQYNNEAARLEQAKYAEQQKQYKAQIERDKIEARAEELDRRKRYIRNKNANITQAAVSGVVVASNSYKALLESNRDQYLNDVSYTTFIGKEKTYVTGSELSQSNLAQRASKSQYKTQAKIGTVKTLLDAAELYTK